MSKTKVKTYYTTEGIYGSTTTLTLYCIHNHSTDVTSFYSSNELGQINQVIMEFKEWGDRPLEEAMQDLLYPFKEEWGEEYKDNVIPFCSLQWNSEKGGYEELPFNDSVYENNPILKVSWDKVNG